MAQVRHLMITCPTCGQVGRYALEPTEHAPLVTLVRCQVEEGGCKVQFAVEIRMRVEIEYSTCRLTLPSTRRPDCLMEAEQLAEAADPGDF